MSEPWSNQYENDFEKELYMASNLFRHSPQKLIPFIRDLKRLNANEFKKDGNMINELCKILTACKQNRQVQFGDAANKACRENNQEIIALDRYNPKKAGDIDYYTKNLSNTENNHAQEFVIITNWTESPMHLVAYQIMKHYKDKKTGKKNLKFENDMHPLMNPHLACIGISMRGHKKINNIVML